ncbi:apolipoprotein N-acyltransferase [Microbacterium proteolyticum]|uniref:Apolipoprotein N-acyltransferase n=1 Tax=Microbacterium proteolyticum TaxID=1572644 RepID=A0A7W5CLP9_9MICO|nr:apolipoprotein N-acyltransferase [Microbacterium proteolyticum]MBB3159480.1 apolipoprotein N-acyltransferase [Microbacterium proteolyticum]
MTALRGATGALRMPSMWTSGTDSLPVTAALPLAAAAGLLMDAATPDLGWWPLAFVSVTILLAALLGRGTLASFVVGCVFGAVFNLAHLVWVAQFLGPVPWLALSALQTVLIGVSSITITLTYRWVKVRRLGGALDLLGIPALVAALWAAREVLVGMWPYSGFPWARVGMTQVSGPFPEVASWVGTTGVTFLVVGVCAALVQALRPGRRTLRAGVPALVGVLLMAVTPQYATRSIGTFTVGWVQGNGPAGYFDDRNEGDMLRAQASTSKTIRGQQMDVLAWPEGSVDIDPASSEPTRRVLSEISAAYGAPLLMNAATTRGEQTFNSTMLWTTDGSEQSYDKLNPVPFGEYVPDRWLFERLAPDLVSLIQREYTPGRSAPVMDIGGTRVGLAICFDVIYDDVIFDAARQGAQVYIFQTNNADFRGTDENVQQLAIARMRAIETGRAVVNVSTVGTSQLINPDGSTEETIGVDTAAGRVSEVPLRAGITPASWLSPTIEIAMVVASAGVLLCVRLRIHVRARKR